MAAPATDTILRVDVASLEALVADLVAEQLEDRAVSEPEPWLTVEQAAEYLACPTSRIYDLVSLRKGDPDAGVEFRKDGRRTLFRRTWLDAVLERG